MQDKIVQKYVTKLSLANHESALLEVELENIKQELSEFLAVLNSDETLKALFYEQKEKLYKGE